MGDGSPCCGAFDGFLPVLGETVAPAEPCEGALDHPAAWQQDEALGGIAATDDFECLLPMPAQCLGEFLTGIAAIREDMAQPGEAVADRLDEIDRAVTVLNAGGVNRDEQHQPERVGNDVTLAAHDLLARVIASHPATFGGFDCQSARERGPGSACNRGPDGDIHRA